LSPASSASGEEWLPVSLTDCLKGIAGKIHPAGGIDPKIRKRFAVLGNENLAASG
jgi:hypothetical protein